MISFPVFNDRKGNRFVFPGVYISDERSYNWSQCRMICAALGVDEEKDRLKVTEVDGKLIFPHVVATAGSPGFRHGSDTVWLIGGPAFDAAMDARLPIERPEGSPTSYPRNVP